MVAFYSEKRKLPFAIVAPTSPNGHEKNGHSKNGYVDVPITLARESAQNIITQLEANVRENLRVSNTSPEKHGLLATPFEFSSTLAESLAEYHKELALAYPDAYFKFTDKGEKPIIESVITDSGWRIRVLPLGALSDKEMAALVHAQTACYEGKDTMGVFPTTRKKNELQFSDVTDDQILENERALITEMVRGWDGDEIVVLLDCPGKDSLKIFAGGVLKFGQQSDISAVQAWLNDTSTIPSFRALRPKLTSELHFPNLESGNMVEAPENRVGCVTRLFSMLSIKKDEMISEGIDVNQVFGVSNLIICYFAVHDRDIDWIVSDTHIPTLHRFSRDHFAGEIIAQGNQQLEVAEKLKDSVHLAHYGYWLTERNRVGISVSPVQAHIEGAEKLIREMNVNWESLHPGYTLPAIERG